MPEEACNTKIDQLDTPGAREHYIPRLHISEDHGRLLAMQEFHHQKMARTLGKEIGEGWQIGMVQTRKNPGLRQEILNGLGLLVRRYRREAHLLDSADSSPPGVPRLIHGGHSPMSDRLHNHVAPVQQGTWV